MNDNDLQTQNMIEQAVYQQLFLGKNQIMGKNPQNTMQITGIKSLLAKFIKDLTNHLILLKNNHLEDFLAIYENQFEVDLSETKERIEANLIAMGDFEEQDIVIYYMSLTKLLETLREVAYARYGRQRIEDEYEERTGNLFDENAQSALQNLAALSEENISLLYNLTFIAMLATSYTNHQFKINMKRFITMRVNKILAQLI